MNRLHHSSVKRCMTCRAPLHVLSATLAVVLIAVSAPAARAADRPEVLGGTVAAQGALPSMANVSALFSDGSGETCSGTVVAPTLILTAAHCVESLTTGVAYQAAAFRVTTGLSNVNASRGGWLSAVTHIYVNPSFHIGSESGDAALLQLKTPTDAPPVALADAAQAAQLGAGTTGILAGWGQTSATADGELSLLHYAQETVLGAPACSAAWGQSYNPATELCALDLPADTAGACHGDSGGPLLTNVDGTTMELGVTIFVGENCATTMPTVYTSVAAIDGWVQATIAAQPTPSVVTKPRPDVTRRRGHRRHAEQRRVRRLARRSSARPERRG
jgi:secreted trypsin-like serine protease